MIRPSLVTRLNRAAFRPAPALLLVAVALTASACTRTLDAEQLHQSISTGINEQLAMPIASVACPEDRAMAAGDTFECTAVPEVGGRLTIAVTQADDSGDVTWKVAKTEGLLDLRLVETSVADNLRAQAQVEATVSCGGRWKAIRTGEVFPCEARTTAGEAVPIDVTTEDADGGISWKTR